MAGADGMMELAPDLVRIPDVSFIAWDRFPDRRMSRDPVPRQAPDLAVEVLSKGNTRKEMEETLDGGAVLPGLEMPIRAIFADVPIDPPTDEPRPGRRRRGEPGSG